jgi:tRNA A37 threonylcarbamoyladenosine synthetase subunit TsaC/SUA5/YrdC
VTDLARGAVASAYWTEREVDDTLHVLRTGGLVLVKGDIGYGLFGRSRAAIEKMYRLKGRPLSNPCIFCGNLDLLDEIAHPPLPAVRSWVADMAARTTIAVVLPVRPDSRVVASMDPWVRTQSVVGESVAVFLNTGPFLEVLVPRALAEGWALVGSSANLSSTGNRYALDEVPDRIRRGADLVVDHGASALANDERLATTIVNFTTWEIQRRGVNAEAIAASFDALRRQVRA